MSNRWAYKITSDVNASIAKGRGPTGKGSRRTTYQNLLRTRREEMQSHSRKMQATFRNANPRSHLYVTNGGKWYLADNPKSLASNHEHFQYFSQVLRDRGLTDAMPVLVEFITFLMGALEITSVIGDDIVTSKKTVKVGASEPEQDEEEKFGGWGKEVSQPAAMGEWGDLGGDEPSFSDEEDQME